MYKLNFAENIFTWQPTNNKILLNLFNDKHIHTFYLFLYRNSSRSETQNS